MSRQVCRDFQRGNCRFGTRCKFLHQIPQQQQTQRNAFDSGPRQTQQQGFGSNRFGALSNTPKVPDGQRQQQQQQPAKDHKCNNPKVCEEQIKEDIRNEQPTFWHLTSYAHWKNLPNDISGDVSPEELRALAYESAKQGVSSHQVVQKEQSMIAVKKAEFEAFQRAPYRGPQVPPGFTQGTFQSSPFLSTGTSTSFGGVAQNVSPPTSGFGQPQTLFGVPVVTPQQGSGGFGNKIFNKTGPTVGTSPFQTAGFGQSGQNIFGTQSTVSPTIFGSQNRSGFGSGNGTAPGFGNFSQLAFSSPVVNDTVSTGFGAFTQSPFTTPTGSQPTSNNDIMADAPVTQVFSTNAPPSDHVQVQAEADPVWKKDVWKLGEIPEDEPPQNVRF